MRKYLVMSGLLALSLQAGAQQLVPLQEGDIPAGCGCRFGADANPRATLIFWSHEEKRGGVVRDAKGLYRLSLYQEKYLPEQREFPRRDDRMTMQLADGTWSIQAVGTVSKACTPKAKKCETGYRARLVVQWMGKSRELIDGWGRCGCPE